MRQIFNHEFSRITQIINFINALKQSFKGEFHEFFTLN